MVDRFRSAAELAAAAYGEVAATALAEAGLSVHLFDDEDATRYDSVCRVVAAAPNLSMHHVPPARSAVPRWGGALQSVRWSTRSRDAGQRGGLDTYTLAG